MTFTIVQQYDYAKHDYLVLEIRHGLDCSYYDTIEDQLVMGTGRKV